MNADASEELDRLAQEFVARHREGDRPSVFDFAARHPERAADIRELFPVLLRMETLRSDVVRQPSGTRLGDYVLLREIGRGGMGVVYEAVQTTLHRRVALKVLPHGATFDPRTSERFRAEARAAGRLHHANVVPVIEYGEEDGVHYYAMQYVEGRGLDAVLASLRRRLACEGDAGGGDPLADALADRLLQGACAGGGAAAGRSRSSRAGRGVRPRRPGRRYHDAVVRLLLQATEGVAAAHAQGVLHRDIKPSNLILDADGKLWVADFGLCKEADGREDTLPGAVAGTLRYLPPERLRGASDVRGDVYGLGITLYEMLTLAPAYASEDRVALLADIARAPPRRPRALDPRIPVDLEAVVRKATAHDPGQRYVTVEGLAADLGAYLEGRAITARAPRATYLLRAWVRRHRALTATVLLAVAALGTGAAFYVRNLAQEEVEARFQQYVASIAAAEGALRLQDPDTARRLLDDAPPELRNWEWQHLESRLDRSLWTIDLGGAEPHGVAYDPDGSRFAIGADDWTSACDDASGREVARLDHEGSVTGVAWSPRGDRIAVGTWEGLEIWSWPDPHRLHRLAGAGQVADLSFSLDGRRVATGGDEGRLRVWDVESGRLEADLGVHAWIHALDFRSGDDRVAVGGGDGIASVWDVATGACLWSRRASDVGLHGITFVGRDRVATPSEAHHVCLWSAASGDLLRIVTRLRQVGAAQVRATTDGTLLAVGSGQGLEIWDARDWTCRATWPGRYAVLDIAFHPSHTCVVTASMGAVKAWAAERDPDVLRGHMDDVTSVAYAPDGAWFVSAGVGGVVRRWDANTGEQARAWIGHRWSVTALAVSPDARLVAAGDATGEVLLWDVERDEVALRIDAHEGAPVHDLAFRHDGTRLATAGADGRLAVWDVATGKPLATVRATDGSLGCVEVTPDDRYVLTGDASGAVRVWDAATLAPVRDLSPHGDLVTGIDCCATRGLVATVSQDDTLRLWNLDDGSLRRVTPLPSPLDVAFSPDGSRLAAGCMDGTVRLFDTASGRLVATLQHVDWVYAVAWSPDGERLLSASSAAEVRVWGTRPLGVRRPREADPSRRRRAVALVAALAEADPDPDVLVRRVRARTDLGPDLREAALREAYRLLGSEEGLIARLWRAATSRDADPLRLRIARGLAADMTRAAGHRNRPDTRRNTLWAALTFRSGDYDLALERLRTSMMLNEDRFPELFAVDLALLALSHAALGHDRDGKEALARLEAHLDDHPKARTPQVEAFLAEAREAVRKATTSPAGASGRETAGAATGGG